MAIYSHESHLNLKAIPVHDNWDLIPQIVKLLNSQWRASDEHRISRLKKSNDSLPCNIVLVSDDAVADSDGKNTMRVIAHALIRWTGRMALRGTVNCDLDQVDSEKEAEAIIESVIVDEPYRKRGIGRHIMHAAESFAKKCGASCVSIATKDDVLAFYSGMGYRRERYWLQGSQGCNDDVEKEKEKQGQRQHAPQTQICLMPAPPPPPPPQCPSFSGSAGPDTTLMYKRL